MGTGTSKHVARHAGGEQATKTDAKNIRTEFSYDAYKRPTEMRKLTLSGGVWTEDRCQRVTYDYTLGGVTTRYLQKVSWGWNASNQPCNNTAGAFEEQYTYLTNGAIASKSLIVIRLIGGQLRSAQLPAFWTYNNEGQPTQLTYPQRSEGAGPITTQARYTYDTMGRSNGVDWRANAGATPPWSPIVSNVTYNAFGAVTGFNHLGQTETRQYNDLGQLTRITQGTAIDIEYRFSATANDGKITSQKNWRTGEDVTYQYDQLERLISASTTAGPQSWGLSWSYDGFGNRLAQSVTQGSGPAHSVLVNASTNRISSAGFSYDPNGNLTAMPQTGGGTLNLTYDLSNRVTNLAHNGWSEDYLYSPDNRRIWRSSAQTFCGASIDNDQGLSWNPGTGAQSQYILYSPAGQKLGVYCLRFSPNGHYNVWTASEENVYWGSRLVGKRIGISAMSHFITDRLHSKGDGSAFYPYGESKTGAAGDDREQFATYTRDQTSGLDYADQRWYSSRLGRFTSPDPLVSRYNLVDNPSRFSYAENDPTNYIDPRGEAGYTVEGLYCVTTKTFHRVTEERREETKCTKVTFTIDVPIPTNTPEIQDYSTTPMGQQYIQECIRHADLSHYESVKNIHDAFRARLAVLQKEKFVHDPVKAAFLALPSTNPLAIAWMFMAALGYNTLQYYNDALPPLKEWLAEMLTSQDEIHKQMIEQCQTIVNILIFQSQ